MRLMITYDTILIYVEYNLYIKNFVGHFFMFI